MVFSKALSSRVVVSEMVKVIFPIVGVLAVMACKQTHRSGGVFFLHKGLKRKK